MSASSYCQPTVSLVVPAHLLCSESLSNYSGFFSCPCVSLFICGRSCTSTNLDGCYRITNAFCCTSFSFLVIQVLLTHFVSCALFYINLLKSLLQVFTEKQGSPLLVYFLHIDFAFIHMKVNTTKHPSHWCSDISHMTELKGIGMCLCKSSFLKLELCSPVSLEIVVVTPFFLLAGWQ